MDGELSDIDEDEIDCEADALLAALTDDTVADFLLENPDFFGRRPDVLACMIPPERWSDDSVADLQRYMVQSLRHELAGMRDCTHEVIETSRSNMATQGRTHGAVLALLEAETLDAFIDVVNHHLGQQVGVNAVVIGVELRPEGLFARGLRPFPPGEIDRRLGDGNHVALMRTFADDSALFGEGAGRVRSAALVRLRMQRAGVDGVLAFGAVDDAAFHPRQGTELLRFLARVVELCLDRHLAPVP